jgi:murein endopeptidase
MDGPHAHIRLLPPAGAERCGSEPACAGSDGAKDSRVLRLSGLQDQSSLGAARRED